MKTLFSKTSSKSNKNFYIIVALIVLLIFAAFFVYLAVRDRDTDEEENEVVDQIYDPVDPVKGWNEHNVDLAGITIKYPTNWNILNHCQGAVADQCQIRVYDSSRDYYWQMDIDPETITENFNYYLLLDELNNIDAYKLNPAKENVFMIATSQDIADFDQSTRDSFQFPAAGEIWGGTVMYQNYDETTQTKDIGIQLNQDGDLGGKLLSISYGFNHENTKTLPIFKSQEYLEAKNIMDRITNSMVVQ